MTIDYKKKYLKYRNKYLQTKKLYGGMEGSEQEKMYVTITTTGDDKFNIPVIKVDGVFPTLYTVFSPIFTEHNLWNRLFYLNKKVVQDEPLLTIGKYCLSVEDTFDEACIEDGARLDFDVIGTLEIQRYIIRDLIGKKKELRQHRINFVNSIREGVENQQCLLNPSHDEYTRKLVNLAIWSLIGNGPTYMDQPAETWTEEARGALGPRHQYKRFSNDEIIKFKKMSAFERYIAEYRRANEVILEFIETDLLRQELNEDQWWQSIHSSEYLKSIILKPNEQYDDDSDDNSDDD